MDLAAKLAVLADACQIRRLVREQWLDQAGLA